MCVCVCVCVCVCMCACMHVNMIVCNCVSDHVCAVTDRAASVMAVLVASFEDLEERQI